MIPDEDRMLILKKLASGFISTEECMEEIKDVEVKHHARAHAIMEAQQQEQHGTEVVCLKLETTDGGVLLYCPSP